MNSLKRHQPAQIGMVMAILLGFLIALASSVSPELHRQVHADAGEEHHECLATAVLTATCDVSVATGVLVLEMPLCVEAAVWPAEARETHSFYLDCRILEHAPPFAALA